MSLNKDGKIRVAVVGPRAFRRLEPCAYVALPVNTGCFSHVMSDTTMSKFVEQGIELHGVKDKPDARWTGCDGFVKEVRGAGAEITYIPELVPGDFYDWVLLVDQTKDPVCAFGYIEEDGDD